MLTNSKPEQRKILQGTVLSQPVVLRNIPFIVLHKGREMACHERVYYS